MQKKITALVLAVLMMVSVFVPSLAAEVQPILQMSITNVQNFENNQDALVNVKATNQTAQAVSADMIVALYDAATNKMLYYTYVSDTVEAENFKEWGACIPVPETGNYRIKAFAWGSIATANLISNIAEISMDDQTDETLQDILAKTGAYVAANVPNPGVQVIGGEWAVFALARSGYEVSDEYYDFYYNQVLDKVKKEASKTESVWDNKVTDVERVILALTSIGKDPRDVDGVNLLDYIWNKKSHFPGIKPDGSLGGRQGANELIFGLLATQANDSFEAPDSAAADTAAMIDELLKYQADGGFSLEKGGDLDVDITAMAIQALAKNQNNVAAKEAALKAVEKLSSLQDQNGHFAAELSGASAASSESVCQVIVALTELGIDPATDSRFIKNGRSAVDALMDFYLGDGKFTHELSDTDADQMATEQALYTLSALKRFYEKQNSLYNMNDVTFTDTPAPSVGREITPEDLAANPYETYYYLKNEAYTYQGEPVTFISQTQFSAGGQIYDLKNQSVAIDVTVTGDKAIITFDSLNTPIGLISGKWNSTYQGKLNIHYSSDIPGMGIVESANNNLQQIEISGLANGTYHLTDGSIYEKANEWSPGVDFGDGKGVVAEGYFGVLPEISFTVSNMPEGEKIGTVTVSVEKRTIGKGDTLPKETIDLYEGDSAWDVVKRALDSKGIEVSFTYNQEYDSVYISSIDGDGEFDHGSGSGWKYQVNGEFPDKGMSQYTLKDQDEIRVRYCVTVQSEELKSPLINYLADLVSETEEKIRLGNYTQDSADAVRKVIASAKEMIDGGLYDSAETAAELAVSEKIAELLTAVDGLVVEQPPVGSDVPDDWENDLWLQYDFKEMTVGDTATIYPRRVPQIISNAITNDVQRPNFHFDIIEGDSVSLEMVKNEAAPERNDSANVTAVKTGTTIVKVTYGGLDYYGYFGPTSSVNAAYVVFDVSEGRDTGISITTDSTLTSYDTIYYDQGNTVNYDITPAVTGADSFVVTCNGKTVDVNADGASYTLPLENRSNIIGIVAKNAQGTKSWYKVIDARKIEIKVVNATDPNRALEAGDTAKISFKGIANPVYKLATIYNPTWLDERWGSKGSFVKYQNSTLGTLKGYCNQWDLATNNTITVTFPEEGVYQFTNGRIFTSWWGSKLGSDKGMEGQGDPNLGADTLERYLCIMPDFSIEVSAAVMRPVESVSITAPNTEVDVGAALALSAVIVPENATNQNVTWSSSDDTVATVNESGVVRGIKAGMATITATTEDGNKTATVDITVSLIPVESVSIDQTDVTVVIETTKKLTATVLPATASDKSVTWSSSNEAVATVAQDGTVRGVAPGTATITVTTTDGGKTSSAKVTVTEGNVIKVSIEKAPGVFMLPETALSIGASESMYADSFLYSVSNNLSNVTLDLKYTQVQILRRNYSINAVTVDGETLANTGDGKWFIELNGERTFQELENVEIPKDATLQIRYSESGDGSEYDGDVPEPDAFAHVTLEVKDGVKILDNFELSEATGYRKDVIIAQAMGPDSGITYEDGGYADVFKSITYNGITYTKENGAGSWEYYINGEKQTMYNTISFVNIKKGDDILIRFIPTIIKEDFAHVTIEVASGTKILDNFALSTPVGPSPVTGGNYKYRKDAIIKQAMGPDSGITYEDGGYADVFKSITYNGVTYTKENGAGSWEYYINGEKQTMYNTISFVELEEGDDIIIRFIPAA